MTGKGALMTRRQYLDKRKESRVLAIRQFHEHLRNCEQCRDHPGKLCDDGRKIVGQRDGSMTQDQLADLFSVIRSS
jgi:hypothetical protein